ncbi:hypothetical protein ZWY2020_039329 [Hordeum vulgare]|nr:hypothetical protein ZWY2020_039329 [Hordeum vulgare]
MMFVSPCCRLTTCWGATRWACRTWWGTAPSTRRSCTTGPPRCHPSQRTRGSSGCSQGFTRLYSGAANPNVHVGAVVGGPNQNDQFPNQRSDYELSEPATYMNAPLVGALAYLAHSSGQL